MSFNKIILTGLSFRLLIYISLIFFPFYHQEQGIFGSFVLQDADLDDYVFVSKILFFDNSPFTYNSCPTGNKCLLLPVSTFFENYTIIFDKFINNQNNLSNLTIIVGPVFPLLLILTNYSSEFPYILSIVCFVLEIISFYLWSKYIFYKSNSLITLLFALFPITILFGLIHSSDIILYFFSSLIILYNLKQIQFNKFIYFLLILFLALTKPASFVLVLSIIIYQLIKNNYGNISTHVFILLLTAIYYLPYFLAETAKIEKEHFPELIILLNYFDFNLNQYSAFFVKYIIKFFLIFGFDFSQSGNNLIYLMKIPSALIMLLGFILTYKNNNVFLKIYIYLYFFLILALFYPTYRYMLPLIPLLIFNLSLLKKKNKI